MIALKRYCNSVKSKLASLTPELGVSDDTDPDMKPRKKGLCLSQSCSLNEGKTELFTHCRRIYIDQRLNYVSAYEKASNTVN